jgi:protein-S-isoprenylcysteine O-methyltransferase Ste14
MLLIGLLLYVAVFVAFVGGVLFVSAGRTDLPFFWTYLVVYATPLFTATIAVYTHDASQIREMIRTRRRSNTQTQDKVTVPIFLLTFLAIWCLAGFDVGRKHWSDDVPFAARLAGLAVFGLGWGLVAWSTTVNQFYSPNVRVQEDRRQRVIGSGPYAVVRHPGYFGWLLFFAGSGVALGSWSAAAPAIVPMVAVLRRTVIEDRMLLHGLAGYPEYAQKVRFRLIPGVW